MRIGIDIGNVIIGADTDNPDVFFGENYLAAPIIPGAIESVRSLVDVYGSEAVQLVSKCYPRIQRRSMEWLEARQFFTATQVSPAQVHFCLQRKEKRKIADALSLNVFVDDRASVLEHLIGLPSILRLILLAPSPDERDRSTRLPNQHLVVVEDWPGALRAIHDTRI